MQIADKFDTRTTAKQAIVQSNDGSMSSLDIDLPTIQNEVVDQDSIYQIKNTTINLDSQIPHDKIKQRQHERSRQRKMAKLQQKQIRKSERIIPHMSQEIISTAATLEAALKLQIVRSNQIFKDFIKSSGDDAKFQTQLEMTMGSQQSNQILDKVDHIDSKSLESSLTNTIQKMVRKLQLPQQCLTIASIYIQRAIKNWQTTEFFLSTLVAEKVTITCLILAAKYYCETEDIVVNIDICRLLAIRQAGSYLEGAKHLMSMELQMLTILKYELFVSLQEYNEAQHKFNVKMTNDKVNLIDKMTQADSNNNEECFDSPQKKFSRSMVDLTNNKEVSKIQILKLKQLNKTPQQALNVASGCPYNFSSYHSDIFIENI